MIPSILYESFDVCYMPFIHWTVKPQANYKLSQCIIAKLNPMSQKLMLCCYKQARMSMIDCVDRKLFSGILAHGTFETSHDQPWSDR